jgi:hypothetical protein
MFGNIIHGYFLCTIVHHPNLQYGFAGRDLQTEPAIGIRNGTFSRLAFDGDAHADQRIIGQGIPYNPADSESRALAVAFMYSEEEYEEATKSVQCHLNQFISLR